jgi:DNA-binding HxlR family transcriptional regulator
VVDSAELFEAISHPLRIKILKTLEKQPASFASLKRQLDIESSGNLDYHLKKLAQLVAVREDGLYGLTDAGKEALMSIETIELWTQMERRKTRTNGKLPWQASFLMLLEFGTAIASTVWFFSAVSPTPLFPIVDYFSGFVLSATIAVLGFVSVLGVFEGERWSWKTVIAKSSLMTLASLIPLSYLSALMETSQGMSSQIARFYPTGVFYAAFVTVEMVAVLLALTNPVREYLISKPVTQLSHRAVLGGAISVVSGTITTVGLSMKIFSETGYNFSSLDLPTSIIFAGGLAVGIGGVLILLRSYRFGALTSVIFGLFPYPAYLAAQVITSRFFESAIGGVGSTIASIILGILPVIGGILALISMRKIQD